MKKKYIYWFLGIMAFLLIVLAVFAWLLFYTEMSYHITVSKETTYYTKPLLPDGRVDYVAVINEISSRGVTPENNGFIPYIHAIGYECKWLDRMSTGPRLHELLGVSEADLALDPNRPTFVCYYNAKDDYIREIKIALEKELGSSYPNAAFNARVDTIENEMRSERYYRAVDQPWSTEDCPFYALWLESNRPSLDAVVEATRRPRWYQPVPHSDERTLQEVIKSYWSYTEQVSENLAARAMLRIGREEFDAALEDIYANKRLARHLAGVPLSFWDAYEIERLTFRPVIAILTHPKRTTQQNLAMLAKLHNFVNLPPRQNSFDLYGRIEMLQNVHNELILNYDEDDSPYYNAIRNVLRRRVDWDRILRENNEYIDQYADVLALPSRSQRIGEIKSINNQIESEIKRLNYHDLTSLIFEPNLTKCFHGFHACFPGLRFSVNIEDHDTANRRMIEIAARLANYRQVNGEYPDSLEAIMNDTLDQGPAEADLLIDPFAETERFRYRKNPDGTTGYFLYSVGENEIDEAGRWDDPYNYDLTTYRDDIAIRIGPQGYVPPSVWNVDPPEEDGESDNSDNDAE